MAASAITNPVDVVKVRLQLQGELDERSVNNSFKHSFKYRGFMHALQTIYLEEGVHGLSKGLSASMLREATYSTLRMGLYDPIKELVCNDEESSHGLSLPLWKKVMAGGIAGAIGASITNPADLIKVRAQASQARGGASVSVWSTGRSIILHEGGWRALYRGCTPTVVRAAVLTASQLPTYDHTKHWLLEKEVVSSDGMMTHVVASVVAGFVCATMTAPIDTIKSRYMSQQVDAHGRGILYSSITQCAVKTYQQEGIRGFYKGWLPQWSRLAPHTILSFAIFEQLRRLAGLKSV